MTRSFYKRRTRGTIKEAEAGLVAACGGLKQAATASRLAKTVLAQCTDDDHATRHLPVDVVADLERASGDPVVTRYLAALSGHLLVPVRGVSREPYPLVLASVTKETGELLGAAGAALREGRLSPAQAHVVKREALDVAAALAEMLADCDAIIAAGDGEP
mgnify:CR=1 FL=1